MNRTIKIKFNSRGEVKKVVGNVGRTRMNLAAYHLHCGNIQPTFGAKLARFFRRLNHFIKMKAVHASDYITGMPQAAELPYIGLEEHNT